MATEDTAWTVSQAAASSQPRIPIANVRLS
jgi:hypothetical protein